MGNSGLTFSAAEIVELRQYTLHPGARDTLLRVFEDHFIEGQEQAGIRIGGIYLDETNPDRFVWLRGFSDIDQRIDALRGFYYGPIWEKHRDVANGTMIDSDDVLLLRPTSPAHCPQEPASSADHPSGEDRVHVSVHLYGDDLELEAWLSTEFHRVLEQMLDTSVATWRSHPGPNGFPELPVREDNAFVWSATFRDTQTRQQAMDRLHSSRVWTSELSHVLGRITAQSLNLRPTRRSRHPRPATRPTVRV
jgi:NIPSNAP